MTHELIVLGLLLAYVIFCPAKYDPAIWLKNWATKESPRQKVKRLTDEAIVEQKRLYQESKELIELFKVKKETNHE